MNRERRVDRRGWGAGVGRPELGDAGVDSVQEPEGELAGEVTEEELVEEGEGEFIDVGEIVDGGQGIEEEAGIGATLGRGGDGDDAGSGDGCGLGHGMALLLRGADAKRPARGGPFVFTL
jgi:hypothetical protein